MQQEDLILKEIMELKGDVSQLKGIVTNGLSSKVTTIDNKLSHFLQTRGETCPVVLQKQSNIGLNRLYVAIISLIVGVVASIPAWVSVIMSGGS